MDYREIFAKAAETHITNYFVELEPPFNEGLTSLQAAKVDYDYFVHL